MPFGEQSNLVNIGQTYFDPLQAIYFDEKNSPFVRDIDHRHGGIAGVDSGHRRRVVCLALPVKSHRPSLSLNSERGSTNGRQIQSFVSHDLAAGFLSTIPI